MRIRHVRAVSLPPAVLVIPAAVVRRSNTARDGLQLCTRLIAAAEMPLGRGTTARSLCVPSSLPLSRRCRCWSEPPALPRCPPLGGGPRRTLALFAPNSEEDRREREAALAIPKEERDAQVAELDEQIKALTRRRAVLTGELYTLRGKFKSMGRDYGLPFMVWWTAVWLCTGVGVFAGITVSSARRLLHGAASRCRWHCRWHCG